MRAFPTSSVSPKSTASARPQRPAGSESVPIARTTLRAGVVGIVSVGITCALNSQKSSVTTSLMRFFRAAAVPV
jgi:hypothetical protein